MTNLFVGLHAKAYTVWAAYLFIGKPLKIKSVIHFRLEFLKAVRFGRYILNKLVWRASCEGLLSLGRIFIIGKSLNIKSVIQRRLEFLKAVRFGRYVSNGFVFWTSHESLHSLSRISISR